MPHRSESSDNYTTGWDYATGGAFWWGGLFILLVALKLLEDSM
jgi:hypothetical protein